MNSRIERWLLMLSHGLNIPDYVENPCRKHRTDTASFLKETFYGYPYVIFLADDKKGKSLEFDRTSLNDAFARATFCESKEGGKYDRVWIAEGVECEYTGSVWVYKNLSGKIRYMGNKSDRYEFGYVESIKDLRDRIIVRRVNEFLQKSSFSGVQVDFGWAKYFTGKLNEKIIFFDFEPLENSS